MCPALLATNPCFTKPLVQCFFPVHTINTQHSIVMSLKIPPPFVNHPLSRVSGIGLEPLWSSDETKPLTTTCYGSIPATRSSRRKKLIILERFSVIRVKVFFGNPELTLKPGVTKKTWSLCPQLSSLSATYKQLRFHKLPVSALSCRFLTKTKMLSILRIWPQKARAKSLAHNQRCF